MRLQEYVPQTTKLQEQTQRLSEITGSLSLAKAQGASTYQPPTLGLDQVVNTWLRQQLAYRMQLVLDLFTIAMTIGEIRAPLHHITSEVFRKGLQWKPAFAVKCKQCGTEYQENVTTCEVCDAEERETTSAAPERASLLVPPDKEQKKRLDEFIPDCNIFDQTLEQVLRQVHFDINCLDDGFLYLAKEYYRGEDGKVRSKVIEIRRLHPAIVEIIVDGNGLPKNKLFVCYMHRSDVAAPAPGPCPTCGLEMVPAMYTFYNRSKPTYLLDSEVIHLQKFAPSETYGWSPILTIFEKALTLVGMDRNLYRTFFERKMPSSMVMVFTDNPDSLQRERAHIQAQMKLDPNYVPLVAVSSKGNRGRVDMVRLFQTLQEMDYLPVRNEIRERIASMWGVTPAWQGAPDAFGGLSTQTAQLSVMSRVVEGDQRIFHDQVFPLICEAFGITDWKLELPTPEEEAESTKIMFALQKIQAVQLLQQMGFDIKIKSQESGLDQIDFVVSGEAKSLQELMGGMQGQQQPPPPGAGEEFDQSFPTEGEPPLEEGANEMPNQDRFTWGPEDVQGLGLMLKADNWIQQLTKAGYPFPVIQSVQGNTVLFLSNNQPYRARFNFGKAVDVQQISPPPTPVTVVSQKKNPLVTPSNREEDESDED